MILQEPVNVGLTEANHIKLKCLVQEELYFSQLMDCYKFAIALSIKKGILPAEFIGNRQTIFGIASIDQNREIYATISTLYPEYNESIYKLMERLADWGIDYMYSLHSESKLDILGIINEE